MTDTTTLPTGLNLDAAPPPPPSPAGDYAPPAGQPVGDAPAQAAPVQPQPEQPVPQTDRLRGPNGQWMSQSQWERDMLGQAPEGGPVQPEALTPIPAPDQPTPQAEAPQPDAAFLEQQRQFAEQQAAFNQQKAEFERQASEQALRDQVTQFERQWQQAEQQTLAATQNLPVDQVAPTMARFYNAREQAKLQLQNQALRQQQEQQLSHYRELEQRQRDSEVRGHYPGFAQQEAGRLLGGQLTNEELAEVVGMAESMGPGAIIPLIEHTIRPRRAMQQQLDQLQRSNAVRQMTDAGVFAVSGGTGQPPGVPRPPKEGWTIDQAAANWY